MIGALVALISLDVTLKLVSAGVIATTMGVVAATNATPIVLETAVPHGVLAANPIHGVVTGVGGNTSANGVWELTALDETHLTLTTYSPAGARANSVGNGSYTGGGTVQVALPDGRVLLGRKHVQRGGAPPRITFVPYGAGGWAFAAYGGVIPDAARPTSLAAETTEQQRMLLQRQIATEKQRFEVHAWGCAVPPDPDFGDYDVTQALYHQVIQSVFSLCTGMDILQGKWQSSDPKIAQWDKRGQEYVLIVEIDQPVLDAALLFVPASTGGEIAVNFTGGSSGDASIIEVPSP